MRQYPGQFAAYRRAEHKDIQLQEYNVLMQFVDWLQEAHPEYAVAYELLVAAEKLYDEAERVRLAALDDGTQMPHLELASAKMIDVLARARGKKE